MDLRLAVLFPSLTKGGVVPVDWRELPPESQPLPDLPELSFVELTQPGPESLSPQYRIARRQLAYTMNLRKALGMRSPGFRPAAVCETFGVQNVQINAFVQTSLGGRTSFLHARGAGSLKASPRHVRFTTGPCLFSDRALAVRDELGRPVEVLHSQAVVTSRVASITADERLSLYELEGVIRQARVIAGFAAELPPTTEISVVADVPRVQYYCYLLEAAAKGLITKELMRAWVQLVDRRHAQVTACLREQLRRQFRLVGLPEPGVEVSAGLTPVRDQLLNCLELGTRPRVSDLARRLAESDQLWAMANAASTPKTLRDLANRSYSLECLRGPEAEALHVSVEDRSEVKIREGALRLIRYWKREGHTVPTVLGLYPLAQVVLGRQFNASLYLNDPGTRFGDDEGEYSAAELLERVYRPDIVAAGR